MSMPSCAAIAKVTSKGVRTDAHLRLIIGAAFHDIYHAGQIRLLRRLQEGKW
jgi:hypothetical protein